MGKTRKDQLHQGSEAVLLLKRMFTGGSLDITEKPKEVYRMSPLFQQHNLNSFLACFNLIRKDYMVQDDKSMLSSFTFLPISVLTKLFLSSQKQVQQRKCCQNVLLINNHPQNSKELK